MSESAEPLGWGAARRLRGRGSIPIALVGALGVLVLVGGLVHGVSEQRLSRRYGAISNGSAEGFELPVDSALLERGRHLVTVVTQCTHCHGPDLAGRELADDPWIGRLHSANLTTGRGGIGRRYSDAQWKNALRRGLDPEGRSLLLMPSAQLAVLSDRDLEAIVAYVRQVPGIDRPTTARRVGWLTRIVLAAGLAPDLVSAEQVATTTAPARAAAIEAASSEYGAYLVALGSCRVCHRDDLAGGLHPLSLPGEPVPPDLTMAGTMKAWRREDFFRAMREGVRPDGRALDREFMPWPAFAGLSDLELEAIWSFLRTQDGSPSVRPEPEAPGAGGTLARRSNEYPALSQR